MANYKWLTLSEAAVYLRTSEIELRDEVEKGELPYSVFRGRVLFNVDQLDRFLLSLQTSSRDNVSGVKLDDTKSGATDITDLGASEGPAPPQDQMQEFVKLWDDGRYFTVKHRTRGASAQHRNEPRIWIYPKKFQIAPRGKGNDLYPSIREIFAKYFTDIKSQATVHFSSPYFSWERFTQFVREVKQLCVDHSPQNE